MFCVFISTLSPRAQSGKDLLLSFPGTCGSVGSQCAGGSEELQRAARQYHTQSIPSTFSTVKVTTTPF